jgi:hypothetical protein
MTTSAILVMLAALAIIPAIWFRSTRRVSKVRQEESNVDADADAPQNTLARFYLDPWWQYGQVNFIWIGYCLYRF